MRSRERRGGARAASYFQILPMMPFPVSFPMVSCSYFTLPLAYSSLSVPPQTLPLHFLFSQFHLYPCL